MSVRRLHIRFSSIRCAVSVFRCTAHKLSRSIGFVRCGSACVDSRESGRERSQASHTVLVAATQVSSRRMNGMKACSTTRKCSSCSEFLFSASCAGLARLAAVVLLLVRMGLSFSSRMPLSSRYLSSHNCTRAGVWLSLHTTSRTTSDRRASSKPQPPIHPCPTMMSRAMGLTHMRGQSSGSVYDSHVHMLDGERESTRSATSRWQRPLIGSAW
mmetsp:Transcript_12594/g.30052  ORF Transcript_12594/g.30052 Transcript_12594/m.30052 type:complete len:214 (-) Transcript_12594:864-1505(-)